MMPDRKLKIARQKDVGCWKGKLKGKLKGKQEGAGKKAKLKGKQEVAGKKAEKKLKGVGNLSHQEQK